MAPLVEFGAVLGGSASLPLHAPPLPSSSRRYAPQCFVGEYASSPCDVSHRASDEPRRCMSLSSALAPSSLASPSIRRVFLRSLCARRRSVSELNPVRGKWAALLPTATLSATTLPDSNSTPTDPKCFANEFRPHHNLTKSQLMIFRQSRRRFCYNTHIPRGACRDAGS